MADPLDIDSVAVDPDHCHRCGTAVWTRSFEGRERAWCPDCDRLFTRSPVPAVHVVVHDEVRVLVLDEPIPQHEGVLSLPGGHARHDEPPGDAAVRELAEETGLRTDPDDLRFLTVHHAETGEIAYYFLTYALERSRTTGDLVPEFEGGEAAFRPVEDVLDATDRIRASDRERIALAFDE